MAAPERRYDQDESSASSEEDFVNAAAATPLPSSRPGSAASTARPSSRTSRTSAGSRSSRRAKVHSSSSSESTDSEEEAELRDELANVDVEAGTVRGAPVEGRVERVMRSITKGNASRVRCSDSQILNRSYLLADDPVHSPPDSRATPPSMMAGRRVAPSRTVRRVLRVRMRGRRGPIRLARPRPQPPMLLIRPSRTSCPSRSAKSLPRPIPRVRL